MRFAVFHLLLAAFLVWRAVLPLEARRGVKALLSLLILAAASFSFWTAVCFGGLLSPELPRSVLIAGNALEAFVVFLALIALLREAVIFITVMLGRMGERAHRAVQKDRRALLGMAAASAALACSGMYEGIRTPDVRDREIPIPDLPQALEGFTFVQLSDLHASALLTEPFMKATVERVNALNPDLILITGDLADGTVERRWRDAAPLGALKARFGVFGCDGNHEHYGDYEKWRRRWDELGIRMLRNECVVLEGLGESGRGRIALAGVCDPRALQFGREGPDAAKAFGKAPPEREALRILMAHQPKYFPAYREAAPFALQLSGHTHGGQLLGMDEWVARMNGGYVRGLYDGPHGAKLYVHPGTGLWNGFPLRLGVSSEIARIRLVSASPLKVS